MGLTLITAPTTEPVSLTEIREHCRVEFAEDNDYLSQCLRAAREVVEGIAGGALISQTWEYTLNKFPSGGKIIVPLPPLIEVVSIKYVPADGIGDVDEYDDTQEYKTLDESMYRVDASSKPAIITPAYGESWPAIRSVTSAVKVRFIAGYSSTADVPSRYKHAIKMLVGHWYEHREAVLVGTISKEIEQGINRLIKPLDNRFF